VYGCISFVNLQIQYSGEHYDQKYIIVALNDGHQKRAVLVSKKLRYHSRIFDSYSKEAPQKWELSVHGGGIIKIDPNEKKISTYGTSGGYGDPNRELVEAILQRFVEKYFPGWDLDVKVTPYIRD